MDRDCVSPASHSAFTTPREFVAFIARLSLANLRSFPWIAAREAGGALTLHGAWFSIADGRVYTLDAASDQFQPH